MVEFLEVERDIRCIGTRHNTWDLKKGNGGRRKAWKSLKPVYLAGTEVAVVQNNSWDVTPVNCLHLVLSYKSGVFENRIDENGTRRDALYRQFVIDDLKELDRKVGVIMRRAVASRGMSRHVIIYNFDKCFKHNGCSNYPMRSTSEAKMALFGDKFGLGPYPPPRVATLYAMHKRLIIENDTQSWWAKIVRSITYVLFDWLVDSPTFNSKIFFFFEKMFR